MKFVAVNDAKYGGAGGAFAVYAGSNPEALDIALHETGHSFAHLADEYAYAGSGGVTGDIYTGAEPSAADVTTDPTGAKWSQWLGYNQPGIGVIGAYEGGDYYSHGIYRPSMDSKMRSLQEPFDAVAREQFILDFYKIVRPIDSSTTGSNLIDAQQLDVRVIDPEIISLRWMIDGKVISDGNADSFASLALQLGAGTHQVSALAYDPTDWVRLDRSSLQQEVDWTVTLTSSTRYALVNDLVSGEEISAAHTRTAADFSADGHSDVLWDNTNGGVSTWTVAGNSTANQVTQGAYNGSVDTSWHIADTFDVNGDGRSDILWRQAGGAVAVWDAIGAAGFNSSSYYHSSVATTWRIAATGDLNGDGKDDILWQNTDGSISAWTSTGTGFIEATYNRGSPGTGWIVEALGDFNGDGRSDILWRNSNGGVAIWQNNGAGTSFNEAAFYQGGLPTSWHVQGVGDFNGDGKDDILWRNDSGAVTLWTSNGTGGFTEGVYNTTVPTSWHIVQVGDFNDDGKADILWRNDNGAVSTWQSNGAGFDQGIYNSSAPTSWSVAAHQFVL